MTYAHINDWTIDALGNPPDHPPRTRLVRVVLGEARRSSGPRVLQDARHPHPPIGVDHAD